MKTIINKLLILAAILSLYAFSYKSNFKDDDYHKGYYLKGTEKIEGYIYFPYDNYKKFFFKKSLIDKKDDKKETISVDECDGFFVDSKLFVILKDVDLKFGIGNFHEKKAFAEVVIKGPLNLYKVYSQVGNPGSIGGGMASSGGVTLHFGRGWTSKSINCIIQKNESQSYVLVPPNSKSKFKNILSEYLSDKPSVAKKIKDGDLTIKTIETLVTDYNYTN